MEEYKKVYLDAFEESCKNPSSIEAVKYKAFLDHLKKKLKVEILFDREIKDVLMSSIDTNRNTFNLERFH